MSCVYYSLEPLSIYHSLIDSSGSLCTIPSYSLRIYLYCGEQIESIRLCMLSDLKITLHASPYKFYLLLLVSIREMRIQLGLDS